MFNQKMLKRVLRLYTPPFVFDEMGGYIYDSEKNMVSDSYIKFSCPARDGEDIKCPIAQVRGWGRIQNKKDPEELQDTVGLVLAQALNDFWEKSQQSSENKINNLADLLWDCSNNEPGINLERAKEKAQNYLKGK